MPIERHSIASTKREKMLERILIAELQKELWRRGKLDLEILHADSDTDGYDIVLESGGQMRHIQLKASHLGATTHRIDVSLDLAKKPSGCVIWIWFDEDTLDLDHFRWFGNSAGERLPDLGERVAKHSRGNSEGIKSNRLNHRTLNKGQLIRLDDISQLLSLLF